MSFRKILFWTHLIAGLTAGLVIAIMAFTGLCLAAKPKALAWADHAAAHVSPPTPATRLALSDVLDQVREDWPDTRVSALVIHADPTRAIDINLGPDGIVYADPYTGSSVDAGSAKLRAFFDLMLRWHRWLGAKDIGIRHLTANITHAACIVFFGLTLTGLYLWWPRRWTPRVLWFKKARGRARDWNWHNVLGLWCSPLLLFLTLTGLIMAYHPFGDARSQPTPTVIRPEGARPLDSDALLALAQTTVPDWTQITLRLGVRRGHARPNLRPPNSELSSLNSQPSTSANSQLSTLNSQLLRSTPPTTLSVEERGSLSPLPRQLTVNPYTGQILSDQTLTQLPLPRALQMLAKPLHTGEAGGWIGAILGAIASLGALVLIYTGFALSWRRFFTRRSQTEPI